MPTSINLLVGEPETPQQPQTDLTPGSHLLGIVVPAPVVTATPAGGVHPSNIPIPGVRSGYSRVAESDFPNQQAAIGPAHPNTAVYFRPRPNEAQDNTAKDSSTRGTYSWNRTTREWNGYLDIFIHSEDAGQSTRNHVPTGKVHYVAAPLSNILTSSGGTQAKAFDCHVIVKFPTIEGRKCAFLLWNTGTNINGEDDIPEGKWNGGTPKGIAAHHYYGIQGGQHVWQPTVTSPNGLQDWHLYTMRYHANGYQGHPTGYIEFLVDGVEISTPPWKTQYIPPDRMWWVWQMETYLKGDPIPGWDQELNGGAGGYNGTAGSGHVYIDWFAIDVKN
jgi:hypothetical protein